MKKAKMILAWLSAIAILFVLFIAHVAMLWFGFTVVQLLILDGGITLLFVLAITLILATERMVANFPVNTVAGVFRFGKFVSFRVLGDEEISTLTEIRKDDAGNEIPNPHLKLVEDGELSKALYLPIITPLFNLRLYSWNPFDNLMDIEIFGHKPANLDDSTSHSIDASGAPISKPIVDKIQIARTPKMVKFLRIISVVNSVDQGVELQGNLMVDYLRQNTICISDLKMIFITQNGHFSTFVNETLRGGFVSLINTLEYHLKDKALTVDGPKAATPGKGFQDMDLSEKPDNPFNKEIRSRIPGSFGVYVITSMISDWTLSPESRKIVDSINAATAATFKRKELEELAIGNAAEIVEDGKAKAGAAEALLDVLEKKASTPAGLIALKVQMNETMSENFGQHQGALVLGGTGGVMPTFSLDTAPPPPTPKTETTT